MKKLFLLAFGLLFLAGCTMDGVGNDSQSQNEMVQVPTITIEATIISLSIDENIECLEVCPAFQYPLDIGYIKINKIISVNNPLEWDLVGISENSEIEVKFSYSSRPVKIRLIPASSQEPSSSNTTVSHVPSSANPVLLEDEFFVYVIESNLVSEVTETILPGFREGSNFNATISYSSSDRIYVGEYVLI